MYHLAQIIGLCSRYKNVFSCVFKFSSINFEELEYKILSAKKSIIEESKVQEREKRDSLWIKIKKTIRKEGIKNE